MNPVRERKRGQLRVSRSEVRGRYLSDAAHCGPARR